MQSLRMIQHVQRPALKDGGERLFHFVAAAGTAASALLVASSFDGQKKKNDPTISTDHEQEDFVVWKRRRWMTITTLCDQAASSSSSSSELNQPNIHTAKPTAPQLLPSSPPSWIRRSLAWLRLTSLPLPRLLVQGDPAFQMDSKALEKRQQDEIKMQDLIQNAITTIHATERRNPKTLQQFNDRCLELAYGDGMTMQKRQEFVHRHGCTGWTDEVLDTIIELGKDRGVVEIGAGNGQWARALMERYQQYMYQQSPTNNYSKQKKKKKFDFVLAYDDQSELPLDQQIYNNKTKIHHDYFYNKVQHCRGSDFSTVLRRFECRGRILLLVYPPPGSMAINAIQQYTSVASGVGGGVSSSSTKNDTVIYVGEGRGGANANDALFDEFENGQWVLMKVMDVKPLGSKGYEKLYILKKRSFQEAS